MKIKWEQFRDSVMTFEQFKEFEQKRKYGAKTSDKINTPNTCSECQFEKGHSQQCSKYKRRLNYEKSMCLL